MSVSYIADIDVRGSEMERPFMRVFVNAETEDEARDIAASQVEGDEVVRGVTPLQPILEEIRERIEQGVRYSICWKHEGGSGPVWIFDLSKQPEGPTSQPFGAADPDGTTTLPWMKRSEAKRLASYLGLTLEDS